MEKIRTFEAKESWVISSLQVLAGSIFLALISQVSIPLPFTPIPISLQTLGVFLLALTLGSKKGALSVAGYLAQASLGLPVIAGALSRPLWFLYPTAGYLIGFVAAAYCIGKMTEKNSSAKSTFLALLAGETIILALGSIGLSFFIGPKNAFMMGAVPFLAGDFFKIMAALVLSKAVFKQKK